MVITFGRHITKGARTVSLSLNPPPAKLFTTHVFNVNFKRARSSSTQFLASEVNKWDKGNPDISLE